MLGLSPEDIPTADGTPLPGDVLSLNFGHRLIWKAQNVRDVDDEETTRFDDGPVELDHLSQQALPILKGEVCFV